MAMLLATFRAAYPEFSEVGDDAFVQSKLDQAASHLKTTAWGTHFDEAHGLETAHLLWISPFGATMRQDSGGELTESRYQRELERLAANVVDVSCVVTGCPRI